MSRTSKPAIALDELIELADLNLAESIREHARFCSVGVIDERGGGLRTLGATRFPAGMFNAVIGTGALPNDLVAWLSEQRAYFDAQQRGFCVYQRGERDAALAQACAALGMTPSDAAPGLLCDEPLAEVALGADVEVERVTTLAGMRELIAVLASSYVSLGLPDNVTYKVFGEPERLLRPHLAWFLARHEGAPAAVAMVLFSHSIAGLYWVGTRPDKRGLGLAAACTRAATNAAFEGGARAVILQASHMGDRLYRRMGYREITRYPRFFSARSQ